MKRFLRRFGKSFSYGEKGFTLIELLIVIAILGVLAAVVIPNVIRYTKSGELAAAKQELENVQTAVDAAMAEKGWVVIDAGEAIGPGTPPVAPATDTDFDITANTGADTAHPGHFLRRTMKGSFEIGTDGVIVAAWYPTDTNGGLDTTPSDTHWTYTLAGGWVEN